MIIYKKTLAVQINQTCIQDNIEMSSTQIGHYSSQITWAFF